ncbi:MAG: hypothetical protein GX330_06570 [Bacteroidales bacterium]|nr:hypothetical protein [Bacteroidales bacterium]
MKKNKNIVAVIFVVAIGACVFYACAEHKLSRIPKEVFLPMESDYQAKVRTALDSAGVFVDPNYPILLTDKPPFEKAIYRDSREFNMLMLDVFATLDGQYWMQRWLLESSSEKMSNKEGERAFMIIGCDKEYIYSGLVREKDDKFYTKYNPEIKDREAVYTTIKTRNMNTFYYWIIREMNKGSVISITGTSKVYLAKSFNETL